MSNLSDFLALGGSGAVKTAYYTTSGSKVLVPHDGVDKLVYIVRGENDGYWVRADGVPLYDRDVVKVTADFGVDVSASVNAPGTEINQFGSPVFNIEGVVVDFLTGRLVSSSTDSGMVYIHDQITSTVVDSFPSPGGSPSGLSQDSVGNLIISDSSTDMIYVMDGVSSTVIDNFVLPSGSVVGIAVDKSRDNLIISDPSEDSIRIQDGISSTTTSIFQISAIYGIFVDYSTGNLVGIENSGGASKMLVFDGISISEIDRFDIPTGSIYGAALDESNGNVILSDRVSPFYIYTLTGPSVRPYAAIRYITQEI